MFNKDFCSGADTFDFIERTDTLMNNGKILRNDETCYRLEMPDIATPGLLAYSEQRNGVLIWKSYFINEYIEGQKISHPIQDNTVD